MSTDVPCVQKEDNRTRPKYVTRVIIVPIKIKMHLSNTYKKSTVRFNKTKVADLIAKNYLLFAIKSATFIFRIFAEKTWVKSTNRQNSNTILIGKPLDFHNGRFFKSLFSSALLCLKSIFRNSMTFHSSDLRTVYEQWLQNREIFDSEFIELQNPRIRFYGTVFSR